MRPLFLCLAIAACSPSGEAEKAAAPKPKERWVDARLLKADDAVQLFAENEVGATSDIAQRPWSVVGPVAAVRIGNDDKPVIEVGTSAGFPRLTFAMREIGLKTVGSMRPGDAVSALCDNGSIDAEVVALTGCRLSFGQYDQTAIEQATADLSRIPEVASVRFNGGDVSTWRIGIVRGAYAPGVAESAVCRHLKKLNLAAGTVMVMLVDETDRMIGTKKCPAG